MALIALFTVMTTLTSCEDENIAYTLEGTWEGNMYQEYQWQGHTYSPTYTEIYFARDPFHFTSGVGTWVDYFRNSPWRTDCIGNHIEWSVKNERIYIYLIEDDIEFEIRNYRLTDNRFRGVLYGSDGSIGEFNLIHTSSPHRDVAWGWDDYYYAKSRSGEANTSTPAEHPVRVTK